MGARDTIAYDDFSWGLNTAGGPHLIDKRELTRAEWTDLTEEGALAKAKGPGRLVATSLGAGTIQMIHELKLRNGTYVLLIVWGRKLYKLNGAADGWDAIPVRLYVPYGLAAANSGSAAGVNIANANNYRYCVVAKLSSGRTTQSTAVAHTSANPAEGITVTWNKSYGADGYDIYRENVTAGGTIDFLATVGDVATYTDDGNTAPDTNTHPPGSNTTDLSFPSGSYPVATDYLNKTYILGGGSFVQYDGTTASVVAPTNTANNNLRTITHDLHTCTIFCIRNDYFFASGAANDPNRIWWCQVGDPTDWQAADTALVQDDAWPITGLLSFGEALVIWKERSVYALFGGIYSTDNTAADVYMVAVDTNQGCVSPRSLTVLNGRPFAWSHEGPVELTGFQAYERDVNLRRVGKQIRLQRGSWTTDELAFTWDDLTGAGNLDTKDDLAGVAFDRVYWLSAPSQSKVVRGYPDRRSDGALAWAGPDSSVDIAVWAVRTSTGRLLGGDASAGIVYLMADDYDNDGAAYTFVAETKDYNRPDLRTKRLKRVKVRSKQQNAANTLTFGIYTDFGYEEESLDLNASAVVGQWTLGDDYLGFMDAPLTASSLRGRGNRVRYRFENGVSGEASVIYGVHEIYSLKKPR